MIYCYLITFIGNTVATLNTKKLELTGKAIWGRTFFGMLNECEGPYVGAIKTYSINVNYNINR